jgi:polysaccharide biosynthesis protein PslH
VDPLRVLVLLPFAPRLDAPHGGGRANAQLVAGLAARHRVAVLHARSAEDPPADPAIVAACERVEEAVRPPRGTGLRWRTRMRARNVGSMLRGRPRLAGQVWLPDLADRFTALVDGWRPDVVQVEFEQMAQYLPARGAVPTVLTVYDPGVAAARELVRATVGVRKAAALMDLAAWRRYEPRILQRVDAVVTLTDADRARLAGGVATRCIPLGVAPPERALDPAGDGARLLFVGGYRHRPNVDAALRLARTILPRVRTRRPDATLRLVGPDPPDELRALAGDGVEVTGAVADVTPYLDAAAVVVVPVRLGGGMRVKVLEALAAGKAVVCSRLAAEGLDVTDGGELVFAESDDDFAAAIVRVLDDAGLRRALARRARAWACARPPAAARIDAYEAIYRELIAPSPAARQPRP